MVMKNELPLKTVHTLLLSRAESTTKAPNVVKVDQIVVLPLEFHVVLCAIPVGFDGLSGGNGNLELVRLNSRSNPTFCQNGKGLVYSLLCDLAARERVLY